MTYNVITTRPAQVVMDEKHLQQIQADLAKRQQDLERLRIAMEVLAAVNETERFAAAAMALVNELAARWKADRVSLGFLKGRYVRLAALSHTEKFTRKMRLVQDIEAAMEECLDQDVEVVFPAAAEATFVSRAAEALSAHHGPMSISSFPLRRAGEVVGVITLERRREQPIMLEEIEVMRLTCDLVTSRMLDLYRNDRWIGARVAASTKEGLAWVVGSKHTWAKIIAVLVVGLIAFSVFVKGTHRVESPFTLEASEKTLVKAGESVEQQTKVIRIVSIDPLWIEVPVPLELARTLKLGGDANIKFDGIKDTQKAKITYIGSVADAASNTLMVRLELPNANNRPAGERVHVDFGDRLAEK